MPPDAPLILHASAVALHGRGLLIRGASGTGKSSLALALMALGADLIADDRTCLQRRDDRVWLSCPPTLSGMIEARGIGILHARAAAPAPLHLVVDLDRQETHRLPPHRCETVLGQDFPLVHNLSNPHFAAMLHHYMLHGRKDG